MTIYAVGQAKQEEVHQTRDVCLAAFGLDLLNQLIIGRGVELDQDLAHNAHARLAAKVNAGQLVKLLDDLGVELFSLAQLHAGDVVFEVVHPLAEQLLRAAGHRLVGADTVEQHHHQITQKQRGNSALEHGRGELPAAVALVGGAKRQCDDRHMAIAGFFERLADKADVVGGTAAAARLRDKQRGMVHIVFAR